GLDFSPLPILGYKMDRVWFEFPNEGSGHWCSAHIDCIAVQRAFLQYHPQHPGHLVMLGADILKQIGRDCIIILVVSGLYIFVKRFQYGLMIIQKIFNHAVGVRDFVTFFLWQTRMRLKPREGSSSLTAEL